MTQPRLAPRFRDILFVTVLCLGGSTAFAATTGKEILDAAGVEGGLVVHLGCGDGKLTAALRGNDRYLVHGLDASAANVTAARSCIQSLGAYGPVSVDRFDGKNLPYIDNHVNLIVAENRHDVSIDEMMRVLVPLGVVYVKTGGVWTKTVKPRPADIDDWTHALYDAGGNAVSKDRVVGPPRRLQWTAGPKWTRHHESMSSFQA